MYVCVSLLYVYDNKTYICLLILIYHTLWLILHEWIALIVLFFHRQNYFTYQYLGSFFLYNHSFEEVIAYTYIHQVKCFDQISLLPFLYSCFCFWSLFHTEKKEHQNTIIPVLLTLIDFVYVYASVWVRACMYSYFIHCLLHITLVSK